MAQWRKTFDSLGGPTYIADPRVDEQARLGELLLARQRAAADQQDRLFGRRQQLESEQARLGEGRRQFDAELAQRQLEARQRLEQQSGEAARAQANADRAFGLDERQAGLAETREQRMERQAIEQAALERARDEAAGRRFDTSQAGEQARFEATQRLAKDQSRDQQLEQIRRDALRSAERAGDQEFATRENMRTEEARAAENKAERASRENQFKEANRLAQEREGRLLETSKADREQERAKIEGTQEQQRAAAIAARAARFRQALEQAAAKGSLTEADQAKAVQQAFRLATQPDLDPQRMTREMQALGPEGEAAANAELRAITAEFFPQQDYVASTGDVFSGPGDVLKGLFAAPLLAAEHPDFLNKNDYARAFATWLARKVGGGAGVERRSAGLNEADRLFGKPKSTSPDERRTSRR